MDDYCRKEKEIAVLETKQEGMGVILKDLQSDMKLVLRKLDSVEVLARSHNELTERVTLLETQDRPSGARTRKRDLANMPPLKKYSIIAAIITAFLSASYTMGSLFTTVGEFLKALPK